MSPELVARFRRLLVLIPFVARHEDGVALDEVLRFAGYAAARELYDDLEMLQLIGVPPGAPDDLIDIYVEGDRVHVALPQGFTRPPRLTAAEAAALLVAAEPLRGCSGKVLDAALARLSAALPPGSEESLAALARAAVIEAPPTPPAHAALAPAIAERTEVTLDYFAASRGEAATRTVEPRSLFLHRGHWYLAALVPERGEEHLFRLDRVLDVRIGTRRFSVPPDRDDSRYRTEFLFFGEQDAEEVELWFSPRSAPLARERFGSAAQLDADGGATVVTRMAGDAWVLSWLTGFAGEVRIRRPERLRLALEARVERLRALYSGEPVAQGAAKTG